MATSLVAAADSARHAVCQRARFFVEVVAAGDAAAAASALADLKQALSVHEQLQAEADAAVAAALGLLRTHQPVSEAAAGGIHP